MPDSRFSLRSQPQAAAGRAGGRVQDAQTRPLETPEADAGLALRQRDEAALAEVYDQHAGAVYGVLHRLLGDAAAQDTLQDVFLRLWERPERFDPARGGLKTFLLVMARSRAQGQLRRDHPTLPLFSEGDAELPLLDTAPGPVGRSEDAQRRERIRAALSQLSAAHRETVERLFWPARAARRSRAR